MSMSITTFITTMMTNVAVAIMTTIMNIIITTMTTNVVVAVMITIITITTMQMRYLQAGVILRAKGIVPSDGTDWLYFDLVPGEYEIRKGNPDITGKLCVIGSKLAEDKLAELFEV